MTNPLANNLHFEQTIYTHPNTIRGQVGLTDTRNTAHGSDSSSSVKEELAHVFPEFNLTEWLKNESHLFKKGLITFDRRLGIHVPVCDHEIENSENEDSKTYSHRGKTVICKNILVFSCFVMNFLK